MPLLALIAFTHVCVSCYGTITTKDVCRSMWKALFLDGSRKNVENHNIVSSSLTIEHFCRKLMKPEVRASLDLLTCQIAVWFDLSITRFSAFSDSTVISQSRPLCNLVANFC